MTNARDPERKRAYNRQYYDDTGGLGQKAYHRRVRRDALVAYGGDPPRCACCGQANERFLTIDHMNGGGTQHRQQIGRGAIAQWLRQNHYPEGFQVLCYNCNMARAAWGACCGEIPEPAPQESTFDPALLQDQSYWEVQT